MARATESRATAADTRPDVEETPKTEAKTEAKSEAKVEPKAKKDPRECAVDDGTPHMGRATPGAVICSAHAMRYKADGTPRAEYVKAEDVKRDE